MSKKFNIGSLKRINSKEAKKYKLLGKAFGVNLKHCIQEGLLHCEDFKEKAKYYVLISNIIAKDTDTQILTGQDSMMVVEFYKE